MRSKERLYLNSDRSRVVKEGDEDAAFLLVGAGGMLSDEEAERYGLKGGGDMAAFDARAAHEARHGSGELMPGERGEGMEAAEDEPAPSGGRKARSAPPENKAQSAPAESK